MLLPHLEYRSHLKPVLPFQQYLHQKTWFSLLQWYLCHIIQSCETEMGHCKYIGIHTYTNIRRMNPTDFDIPEYLFCVCAYTMPIRLVRLIVTAIFLIWFWGHYQHLTARLCLGQQVLLSAADALKPEKTILKHNNAVLFQRSCTKLRAISSDVVEVHVIPGER